MGSKCNFEKKPKNNNTLFNKNDYEKVLEQKGDSQINLSLFKKCYIVGKGGSGRVWKVKLKKDNKIYALKELNKIHLSKTSSISNLLKEQKILTKIRHPFISNLYYSFQDKENAYLIMDYFSCGNLRQYMEGNTAFKEEQIKFFAANILIALKYLHEKNIIHRDIKPDNLVFDEEGYLNLTDFGISHIYDPNEVVNKKNYDSSGTPGYFPPEVYKYQKQTPTFDYFSLGVLLYELIFNKKPYSGRGYTLKTNLLTKNINLKYKDLPKGYSPYLADLLNGLLARKQNQRLGYESINEIIQHKWFSDIDWVNMENKNLTNIPFTPNVTLEGYIDEGYSLFDNSNFTNDDNNIKNLNSINQIYFKNFYFDIFKDNEFYQNYKVAGRYSFKKIRKSNKYGLSENNKISEDTTVDTY